MLKGEYEYENQLNDSGRISRSHLIAIGRGSHGTGVSMCVRVFNTPDKY